jgi:hypothetical protein
MTPFIQPFGDDKMVEVENRLIVQRLHVGFGVGEQESVTVVKERDVWSWSALCLESGGGHLKPQDEIAQH